ncbi:hypothetical protein DU475_09425 [Rhodopseudomonas sp. WA056]|uniref:hypothetical protein n=1 Tax=Rhodopseudomonas TaxID=1073 RepID=UPI00115E3403|nr:MULTISPECIES: hypothetical protein [Rhodopseudomonas]NEW87481.1 hypothetical protein [Rhodopseudomonas sp. WA056]QDL96330.1 hypothetical protein FLL57_02975 [Rhodopseudomonas palustris]
MARTTDPQRPSPPGTKPIAIWAVILILLVLLGLAGVFAYEGLVTGDVDVPVQGYVAMALGIGFSLLIGIGLMVLVFYSSRKGYDAPATLLAKRSEIDDTASGTSDRQ